MTDHCGWASLLVTVSLLGAATPSFAEPRGRAPAEHVIVPAAEAPRFFAGFEGGSPTFWTPTEAQVRALEGRLGAYLDAHAPAGSRPRGSLSSYRVQYLGLVRDGRQVIFANFFCEARGLDWRHGPVVVDDGGDCYFHVEYDPGAGTFARLAINGEA